MKHLLSHKLTWSLLILVAFFTNTISSAGEIVDLRSKLSPVRSQGARNTCSAFEAVVLAEFLIAAETGKEIRLSENYNYWTGKNIGLSTPYLQDAYLHVDGLAAYLAVEGMSKGVMLESSWPYVTTNSVLSGDPACLGLGDLTPSVCFTGTPPVTAEIVPYKFNPIYIAREKLGEDLMKNQRPILMNINWYYKAVDSLGNIHMPSEEDVKECEVNGNPKACGGHVILLVGYDPNLHSFIFRSSWGEKWGTEGYGTVSEEFIMKHCETCRYLNLNPADLSADDIETITKSTQGVSAELIKTEK